MSLLSIEYLLSNIQQIDKVTPRVSLLQLVAENFFWLVLSMGFLVGIYMVLTDHQLCHVGLNLARSTIEFSLPVYTEWPLWVSCISQRISFYVTVPF